MTTSRVSILGLLLCSAFGCTAQEEASTAGEGQLVDDGSSSLAEVCRSPEIVKLKRPRSSVDASRGTFTYRLWFRKPASKELPTVVHVPGGPGSTSIGHEQAWVPPAWGLVTTDPRGVGCNLTSDVDAESFYRTDELANDVVAAIAHLQTQGMGKFVLHGHSYGTILATHIAHRLAEPDQPKPDAVILEGVLGRAFTTEWMAASYVEEWELQRATLSESVRRALREPKPLGWDGKVWGNFFMILSSQFGPDATQNTFKLLEPDAAGNGVPENIAQLKSLIEMFGKIEVANTAALVLQKNIACREITSDLPEDNVDVVLDNGEIVKAPNVGTLCQGIELSRPFNARDHLFPFRTYYFLGGHDTATPLWQGKLHFDMLTTADRVEVVVKSAGHLPLSGHLATCGPTLLDAVANGEGFGAALGACGVPVDVRSGRAER